MTNFDSLITNDGQAHVEVTFIADIREVSMDCRSATALCM
jgi:hypothetical protein